MIERPVTLITGARKGIGKYLVKHYINKGHFVIGCSRMEADWAIEGYEHYIADVADETAVQNIFREIRSKHGRLDHLLNNAGIASMNHVMLTPISMVQQILTTNIVGTFLFCREAAKIMKKNNFGRIINFSTIAVPLKLEGESIYAASKSAVTTLTEILAKELSAFGITVNAVGPTPIETDLIKSVPKEKINQIITRQAVKRLGRFEDVSNVTDFFIRPESDFVTGQILYLGGV
jgi:3-oxoacyl-[acyl-carrier protein] reductase